MGKADCDIAKKSIQDTRFVTSLVPQLLTMNEPVLSAHTTHPCTAAVGTYSKVSLGLQRETVYDLKTLMSTS